MLFESWVVSEKIKKMSTSTSSLLLTFYRDRDAVEADSIIETDSLCTVNAWKSEETATISIFDSSKRVCKNLHDAQIDHPINVVEQHVFFTSDYTYSLQPVV